MLPRNYAASALLQQGKLTPTKQRIGLARVEEFTPDKNISLRDNNSIARDRRRGPPESSQSYHRK